MGTALKLAFFAFLTAIIYTYLKCTEIPKIPEIDENKWWGPGEPIKKVSTKITPFKINVSNQILDDLKTRLNLHIPLQTSLEGVNQNYGINHKLLTSIIDYWKTKYQWREREKFLNKFPQYQTKIQGLNIHFLHVKISPQKTIDNNKNIEILPLLLLHGWPGSVREFYEIIPYLTTPQKERNYIFEIIAPSLPGYGFSEAASKIGMNPFEMGHIFNTLMHERLGFEKYYVQGGDWGSIIAHNIAVKYPENILGIHRNFCAGSTHFHWKSFIGAYFPSLFYTAQEAKEYFPLRKTFEFLLLESGYLHLQSTKPDTVGVALRESPVGLAAYILEKFVTWTNREWKNLPDGGLTKKFTYDQLLDNVMIYWITNSITTSMRLYAETWSKNYQKIEIQKIPIDVPSGCARFKNELYLSAENILKEVNTKLMHLTYYDDGGHFIALEEPKILANDIFQFVDKVRSTTKNL